MESLSYKTISANAANVDKQWVLIDATDAVLGRLASQVAKILRGKNKPSFTPHVDCGDNVVIINAEKVKLTGNKLSGQAVCPPFGLSRGRAGNHSCGVPQEKARIHHRKAVKGMLPRTRLGAAQLRNLKVYAGAEHPHAAQAPKTVKLNEIK